MPRALCLLPSALLLSVSAHAAAPNLLGVHQPAASGTSAYRVTLSADGFAANDFTDIEDIGEEWRRVPDPRAGQNNAIAFARLEAGIQRGNWRIATVTRQDWTVKANTGAVNLYYAFGDPDRLFGAPVRIDAKYRMEGFSADGLSLGWTETVSEGRLHLGATVNLLRGRTVRSESITASVVGDGSSGSVSGQREVYFSGMKAVPPPGDLLDFSPWQAQSTEAGRGSSLDLGLRWQATPAIHVGIAANDLFGRIKWRSVPHMRQRFNDANWPLKDNVPDESGAPTVTGWSGYSDLSLSLDPKYAAEVAWNSGRWESTVGVASTRGITLPSLAVRWGEPGGWQLRADYETRFRSIGLGVGYRWLQIGVRADRLDDQARALGAAAKLSVDF